MQAFLHGALGVDAEDLLSALTVVDEQGDTAAPAGQMGDATAGWQGKLGGGGDPGCKGCGCRSGGFPPTTCAGALQHQHKSDEDQHRTEDDKPLQDTHG